MVDKGIFCSYIVQDLYFTIMKHYINTLVLSIALWLTSCSSEVPPIDPIQVLRDHQSHPELVVRFARLEIDPSKLTEYMAYLNEGIKTSINTEPGVLTMYAVQERSAPWRITVLEVYASEAAYQSHLNTAHFKKYKNGTIEMVQKLELIDLDPIFFGVNP